MDDLEQVLVKLSLRITWCPHVNAGGVCAQFVHGRTWHLTLRIYFELTGWCIFHVLPGLPSSNTSIGNHATSDFLYDISADFCFKDFLLPCLKRLTILYDMKTSCAHIQYGDLRWSRQWMISMPDSSLFSPLWVMWWAANPHTYTISTTGSQRIQRRCNLSVFILPYLLFDSWLLLWKAHVL